MNLKEIRTAALGGSIIGCIGMWFVIGHFPVGSFFMVVLVLGIWIGSKLSDDPPNPPDSSV